jgi:serine/threonine protein kinase
MAAPAANTDLLELIGKSGLLDDKRLEAHVLKLRAAGTLPSEPGQLANQLIRDGFLTHFQAEQLLQGKWRRFTIGRYKVLERIGSGGMASVFLCEHKLMRRRVAVKVLPTAKAADPASLERFHREARAVAALDHPNIVHAYDIDQDENLHFLVMEYVDGASLQDLVKRSGPLSLPRAAQYIHQTALGLEHAHAAGLIHRDIKPANLLVDRLGTVKILDMGLARFFNDEDDILTKKYDDQVLGTADYLAPEQAVDSHAVDVRADIYSLGATFYFLLTGRTPFGEGTVTEKLMWHQTRRPQPVTEFRTDVPEEIARLIDTMMAKFPEQRLQLPRDVVAALADWARTPVAPPTEAEIPPLSLAASGGPTGGGGESTLVTSPSPAPPASSRRKLAPAMPMDNATSRPLSARPARAPKPSPAAVPAATPVRPARQARNHAPAVVAAAAPPQAAAKPTRRRPGIVLGMLALIVGVALMLAGMWLR